MFKKYRIANNYTQEELAEILNISTRHYQRIEKDFRKTTVSMLMEIIKVLKISDVDIIKLLKNSD